MSVKIILDLEKKPIKNDLLIFNGEKFSPIQKNKLLEEMDVKHSEKESLMSNDIDLLQKICDKLSEQIKDLEKEIRILKGEEENEEID